MVSTINGYARRPQQALFADGLADVLAGIVYLGLAFMYYANMIFNTAIHGHDFWRTPDFKAKLAFFLFALIVPIALGKMSRRKIEDIRQTFVYPRLGYVSPPIADKSRRVIIAIVSVVIALLMPVVNVLVPLSVPLSLRLIDMTVLFLGTILGVIYIFVYFQYGFVRHLAIAGIAIATGILVYPFHLPLYEGICSFLITIALTMIVAGAIPFLKLIRTPVSVEADAE